MPAQSAGDKPLSALTIILLIAALLVMLVLVFHDKLGEVLVSRFT